MKLKRFLVALAVLIGVVFLITSNLFVSVPDFKPVARSPVDGLFRLAAQTKVDGAFKSATSRKNINDTSVDWQKICLKVCRQNAVHPTHGQQRFTTKMNFGWERSLKAGVSGQR